MRRNLQIIVAAGLFFGFIRFGLAGEGDAAAIIEKAVKAHFPKGLDTKNQGVRTKSKGMIHVQGLDLEFSNEVSVQGASKFKEVVEMNVLGKKITVTSVYNGTKAWIVADGKEVPVNDDILAEFKDAAYSIGMMQGVFAKDKTVKYSIIGEAQVKGKAAVGVNVSREGKKDISIYFDKKTGLIAKIEMRKRDLMSGQETTEERFVTEYQALDGRMVAKKVEVQRDGKAFLEAEVTEVQVLEKIGDEEFAQPK